WYWLDGIASEFVGCARLSSARLVCWKRRATLATACGSARAGSLRYHEQSERLRQVEYHVEKRQAILACLFRSCPAIFFLGPGTRGPRLALSTLYRAHRSHCLLLITADVHHLFFLDRA